MDALIPRNGCVLVELRGSQHKNVITTQSKYASEKEGTILAADPGDDKLQALVGKRGFWREYKDDCRIERGGKLYAFIEAKDIMGTETV